MNSNKKHDFRCGDLVSVSFAPYARREPTLAVVLEKVGCYDGSFAWRVLYPNGQRHLHADKRLELVAKEKQ